LSSATVLIVEDEDSLRETLSRFLTREGYNVIAAANGSQAFDEAVAACPDVLIADWMLKDHLHGLHVAEAFKAVNPALHTILITGFPTQDLLAESDKAGVLQLLEKPFDLADLGEAVSRAQRTGPQGNGRGRPVAVLDLDDKGFIRFASERARELFAAAGAGAEIAHLQELLGDDVADALARAEADWLPISPLGEGRDKWLLRTRRRSVDGGWLVVIFPEAERARTTDPRVRILLEHRSRPSPILPDHGPVVVIERDGAVRRLLVSQIERIGALCYPTDDLAAAIKLLAAEPRVRTVLIDFALAGDSMIDWALAVRRTRPEAVVIGTGGAGAEDELLAQGVNRVLPKPWRIMDLLDAIAH
jgi:DNA-binding NtrC family response regulator